MGACSGVCCTVASVLAMTLKLFNYLGTGTCSVWINADWFVLIILSRTAKSTTLYAALLQQVHAPCTFLGLDNLRARIQERV